MIAPSLIFYSSEYSARGSGAVNGFRHETLCEFFFGQRRYYSTKIG